MNYMTLSDEDLVETLVEAGHLPEKRLLQVCMERYASLRPALLDLLADVGDPEWDEDDPRWYASIHAGRLLIAHREPDAIPIFIEILGDEERQNLAEWFENDLHHYGPALLPQLFEFLNDEWRASSLRISAIDILTCIAARFPETRQPVLATLRTQLPPLLEDGRVEVDDLVEEDVELWTFAANGLGELADKRSLPHIEALHDQGLIDETIYGDFEDFKQEFFSPRGFRRQRRKNSFDIYHAYRYRD